MAATHESKEAILLQILCSGIGLVQKYVRIMWQSECNFSSEEIGLSFKDKAYWCSISLCERHDWRKKVSLMKVDTLKNVADSLKKFVSTEKFSWCRGYMGIVSLDCWLCNPVTPCVQRKQQVGECWVCVIFFARHIFVGFGPTYYRRADIFPGRHISGTTWY